MPRSTCGQHGAASLAIGEAQAGWLADVPGRMDIGPLSRGRFGPISDDVLISRGVWQYAHYYDPVIDAGQLNR